MKELITTAITAFVGIFIFTKISNKINKKGA